jgi:hypothetical protein
MFVETLKLSLCSFYTIDYVTRLVMHFPNLYYNLLIYMSTSDLTALAFALLQYIWVRVVAAQFAHTKKRHIRVALVAVKAWTIFAVISCIIAPCAIAFTCVCDGTTCSSNQGDQMYYSMFLIVQGICDTEISILH